MNTANKTKRNAAANIITTILAIRDNVQHEIEPSSLMSTPTTTAAQQYSKSRQAVAGSDMHAIFLVDSRVQLKIIQRTVNRKSPDDNKMTSPPFFATGESPERCRFCFISKTGRQDVGAGFTHPGGSVVLVPGWMSPLSQDACYDRGILYTVFGLNLFLNDLLNAP